MNDSTSRFNRWENQTIALAAVAQCAALVNRLATRGDAPQVEFVAAINPLLVLDPETVGDIYPRVNDLGLGLRTLQEIFASERSSQNADIVRYTLGMLLLRSKLDANRGMQTSIRNSLQHIEPLQIDPAAEGDDAPQEAENPAPQDETVAELASLYQQTISTLSYRIQVQGKVEYLKDEKIANRIRALLLAGIRSAVLWYQLGGRRWRLVLYRKKIQETTQLIRRKLITTV